MEQRYQEAIQANEKAIKLNPQFAIAWSSKSAELGFIGKYKEALHAIDKAIEPDSKDTVDWSNKG